MNEQPSANQNLLQDAFGATVRDLRVRCNLLASQSMARFTLLCFAFIVVLMVRAWI